MKLENKSKMFARINEIKICYTNSFALTKSILALLELGEVGAKLGSNGK